MYRSIITAVLACAVSGAALASPITLKGVNTDMAHEEVVAAIVERGGACSPLIITYEPHPILLDPQHRKPDGFSQRCRTTKGSGSPDDIIIQLTLRKHPRSIEFDCRATSTCDLTPGQATEALIKAMIIPEAKRDLSSYFGENFSFHADDGGWITIGNFSIDNNPSITLHFNQRQMLESVDFD